MPTLCDLPEKSIWEEIVQEHELRRRGVTDAEIDQFRDPVIQYEANKHSPVFFGTRFVSARAELNPADEFDPSLSHPALVGYSLASSILCDGKAAQKEDDSAVDPTKSTPREYLDTFIYPELIPALEAMLYDAKRFKCFERKRFRFNGCDFLTEYLYRNNKRFTDRKGVRLNDIPFVQEELKEHPRPPLPLSLIWTPEEAAIVIESFWRGFLVRRREDVQELRKWQKKCREERQDVRKKVSSFWAKTALAGDDADE